MGHYLVEGYTDSDTEHAKVDICFGAEGFEYYVIHTRPRETCPHPPLDRPCNLNVVLKPKARASSR
jgi:hypothetical protein